jgi:hypothetical protein
VRKERTSRRFFWKTIMLEIVKRRVDLSVRIRKTSDDIVEGSVPSETKEETAHIVRAGDAEAPATVGSLPAQTEKRIFIVCILMCVMM